MARLPDWIRLSLKTDEAYRQVRASLTGRQLHTVCESARCPNRQACWNEGTATLMIMGDRCTRNCRFCAVTYGQPEPPDEREPERVAESVAELGLRYLVVTSVTRDDLPDGGAEVFARVIRAVRAVCPDIGIEVLTPDFNGAADALNVVLEERPDVFNHNLETVRRLQSAIRPQASYETSLHVLRMASEHSSGPVVKSGLMLGLGETDEEIREALFDVRRAGCSLLTLGQYLAPSRSHWPVDRYVEPAHFDRWAEEARTLGFEGVASGPLVRSSYRADRLLEQAKHASV